MFERFTEKARRAVFFARYEASQYGNSYIETEHLLLGLWREDLALRGILKDTGYDSEIRAAIERVISRGAPISTSIEMPLSADSKKALLLPPRKPTDSVSVTLELSMCFSAFCD